MSSVTTYSGQQVRPNTALKGLHSQPPQVVPGHNFQVFTDWETWSPCSKCGEVGKRIRYGICTVKLLQGDSLKTNESKVTDTLADEADNQTTTTKTSEISSNRSARTITQTAERQTMKILTLFKKGIPCRSSLLPPELQTIPEIYTHKSEVMVAFCKVCVPRILCHDSYIS